MTYKDVLQRERIAKSICAELNNYMDLKSTLSVIISRVQELSGCEAVGIRLEDDGDYPYYVYNGYPESFILKESSLCSQDVCGMRIPSDGTKTYSLDCMCGKILNSQTDITKEYFSVNGSFWNNDLTKLLECANEFSGPMRFNCFTFGYKSLTLIPIKARGDIVGLIQLNDKRPDIFSISMIEFLEMICENIGLAVVNSYLYTKLLENVELKQELLNQSAALKQAEELDRLRTEFFSNLSHELRTPINIIINSLKLIDLYKDKGLLIETSEKVSRQLKTLHQNSFRMVKLINNILDISKIDSGCYDLVMQNIEIVKFIEEITNSVIEYAENKGLQLSFKTLIHEKIICCDPDRIERSLLNLLSNSIKFTKSGGHIIVTVSDSINYISISVKDNGIGIPQDKLGIVFDRFQQVDKTFTRQTEGSGLGLSLVKLLIEKHGGTVTVNSEYGKGSEFILNLPNQTLEDNHESICEMTNINNYESVKIEFSDI